MPFRQKERKDCNILGKKIRALQLRFVLVKQKIKISFIKIAQINMYLY